MDNIILSAANKEINGQATGCSTICINENGQVSYIVIQYLSLRNFVAN